jgi:hypothetical protein
MEVPPIFSTEILEEFTSDMGKLMKAKRLESRAKSPLFSTTLQLRSF